MSILWQNKKKIIYAEVLLDEFLWGNSLWADGYFAETVGIASEDMINKYIQEQRQ